MSFSTFISSAIVRAIACIGIAATLLPTVPSQTHEVNPAPAPNTTSQAMQPSTNQTPPSAVPQTTPNPPSQATQTPTNQASPSAGPQTTPSPGTQTTQPPANQTLPGTGPQTTPNPSSQATQPPANQTPPGTGPQTTSTPSGQATQPTTNQTPSGTGPQTTSTPSGQATQPSTNRTNPSARTRTTGGFLPLWSITPSSIFDLESTKSVPNGTPPNTKNPNGNSGVTPTSTQLMTEALHFRLGPEYNNPEVNVTYQLPGESGLAPAPVDQGVPGGLDIVLPADKAMLLVQFEFCSKSPCNANQLLDVPGTLTPERMSDLYPGNSCPSSGKDIDGKEVFPPCTIEVVFVRELIDSSDEENPYFTPAFIVSKEGLEVDKDLIEMSTKEGSATFLVNGLTLKDYFAKESSVDFLSTTDSVAGGDEGSYQSPKGWQSVQEFIFARYPAASSCLPYAPDDEKEELDVMRPDYEPVNLGVDNGIILYPPKVFDVVTLRQMLATTAAQLAGITGFSPASITGAFGNLQGVTTDISYLSAQVTTVPTAVVTSQAVNGNTGNNTVANVTGQNAAVTNTNSNITCPAGTLPGIGTSGLPACVALTATNTQSAATSISAETQNGSTASSNSAGSTLTTSGAGNLNGGSSLLTGSTANNGTNSNNSNTTVHGTNQQNTTTTTSGGQAGTISAVPVSNAPSAPTNVGVSAQDILTEQVQLNSQITTLRLALQGALSDQYLVSQGNATGTRQQTTLGINISLDPPQRYKHAVAEVRLWVYAVNARKPVSIVNLLPAAKTYNVAKITNNQKAFGAGVVIDPVNVGVAGGKTKNRLYLAKDTDTVALEYLPHHDGVTDPWPHGAIPVGRSAQENIRDPVRESEIWQTITDACADDPGPSKDTEDGASNGMANPVVLGWQFRPVLGADYVQGGMRQVFAQLAMPNLTGQMSAPKVFIQTRWREYDSKRQVVGQVYKGSCSLVEDLEPIMISLL